MTTDSETSLKGARNRKGAMPIGLSLAFADENGLTTDLEMSQWLLARKLREPMGILCSGWPARDRQPGQPNSTDFRRFK